MAATKLFNVDDPDDPPKHRRRKDDDTTVLGVRWPVILQVLGWILAAFVTYNAITIRMALVEAAQSRLTEDIKEMKGDIKTLIARPYKQ